MNGSEKLVAILIVSIASVLLYLISAIYRYNVEASKFPKPERVTCPCMRGEPVR
jgi:hypothetical protein